MKAARASTQQLLFEQHPEPPPPSVAVAAASFAFGAVARGSPGGASGSGARAFRVGLPADAAAGRNAIVLPPFAVFEATATEREPDWARVHACPVCASVF